MPKSLTEEYMAMEGANRFLAEHCGKTLEEIRKAYRGMSHSANLSHADSADCWAAIEELTRRVDSLDKDQRESGAAIGKLQEQVALLETAMEKARKVFGDLERRLGKPTPEATRPGRTEGNS